MQPFEYTAKVNHDGSVATLESYIHILSSQNENALFRLRIRALIPAAGASKKDKKAPVGETLELFSEPIQVISKPSVLRRKHERERAKHNDLVAGATPSSAAAAAAAPIDAPSSTKRTRDDMILETLAEIKRKQEQQQRILETLAGGSPPTSPAARSSSSSSPADSLHSSPLVAIEPPTESFETLFKNCVRAFTNMDRESRGGKVRKVLRELGASGATFAEAVWSESFQREIDAQVGRIALLDNAPTGAPLNNSGWRADSAVWRITSSEAAATVADADFTDVLDTGN